MREILFVTPGAKAPFINMDQLTPVWMSNYIRYKVWSW